MDDKTSDPGSWAKEIAAARGTKGREWSVSNDRAGYPGTWEVERPVVPDMVNSPPHYTAGGIEAIDVIRAKLTPQQFEGYVIGNALKYISRIGKKGDKSEDAAKARWYLHWLEKGGPRK